METMTGYSNVQDRSRTIEDPHKIVRTFTASKFTYGIDSRQRTLNPDYHPVIHQSRDGRYLNSAGDEISADQIPQYILDQGAPPRTTKLVGGNINLRQAQSAAGVHDPEEDPDADVQSVFGPQAPAHPQAPAPAPKSRARKKGTKSK